MFVLLLDMFRVVDSGFMESMDAEVENRSAGSPEEEQRADLWV